jgi:hypothetical protein
MRGAIDILRQAGGGLFGGAAGRRPRSYHIGAPPPVAAKQCAPKSEAQISRLRPGASRDPFFRCSEFSKKIQTLPTVTTHAWAAWAPLSLAFAAVLGE